MFRAVTREDKLSKLKEQEVIVHVWTSEHNVRKKGMHKGCVSLELTGNNKAYLSFVQNTEEANDLGQEEYNTCLKDDIQSIGRKPEYSFRFYDLNQKAIAEQMDLLKNERTKVEPKNSAHQIWALLKAGNIERNISNTEQWAGNAQEKMKGKGHKLKGDAVILGKLAGPVSTIVSSVCSPEQKIAVTVVTAVATTAGALSKTAPKEVQEHPLETFVHGVRYSWTHTASGHKTPDNIVKSLEIAQKNELKCKPLIKMLNENTDTQLSQQSGPEVKKA